MAVLVDVVNFNADASCLSSANWLNMLEGGAESQFMRWLDFYVKFGRKVVLGFTGATIADMATFNPDSVAFINAHPDVFELIIRPFTHDIGLLRSRSGFLLNLDYGYKAVSREFDAVTSYFLPPEFMLTNEQIALLYAREIKGVFINPSRFSRDVMHRIPTLPYRVTGVLGSQLDCIPFHSELTGHYLDALHRFDCFKWNDTLSAQGGDVLFSWRDGESSFLFPSGLERESYWLEQQCDAIERSHIKGLNVSFESNFPGRKDSYCSYPVHSFFAWMQEFRMLGYLDRLGLLERSLESFTPEQVYLWLLTINSDILSAIEKKSPQVRIRERNTDDTLIDYTVQRSERGFEGEEYLVILEHALREGFLPDYFSKSNASHMIKLRGRIEYLARLDGNSRC